MEYKLRKATRIDIPQLVELNGMLCDYHHSIDTYWRSGEQMKESFLEFITTEIENEERFWLVAEHQHKIIAYFSANILQRPAINNLRCGHISDAFVIDAFRRKNVTKSAFPILMEWFKKQEVKTVDLNIDLKNQDALKTWEHFGFKEYVKRLRIDIQ